jgi:general secretion pathway protein A
MYEQFFALDDAPFRLTPDPRYLFLSQKHAEALAHLRLGLTDSSGFVCITGDIGTGKTTLLRTFLGELGSDIAAAYVLTPAASTVELLRRLCRELGLPAASQSQMELVESLHAHLLALHAAGRVAVVVLDEAQALSIELLEQIRLLLNLETETEKLLRIVLVGQPELRRLMLDPRLAQLNQRITLRWHLGPLSRRETAAYVRHRLEVASHGRAVNVFTRPALRLLHGVSGGVPRLINMIGHRALLAAFIDRHAKVTRRYVARAYRELQTVPLPGTPSPVRKVAWAAGGIAFGASLFAVAAPLLDRALSASPAAPAQAGVASLATPAARLPGRVVSLAELRQHLRAVDPAESGRQAAAAVVAAWGARPLAADEASASIDFAAIAWRRDFEALALTANRSMLRVLDLPAVLELNEPGADGPRYVALTAMGDAEVELASDGRRARVAPEELDGLWSGSTHLLWRDFEGLGATFGSGAQGATVMRLQDLLRRAGAYAGEPTGIVDGRTRAAIVSFQRARRLEPDGWVGPLTRIVLYGAVGGYRRPTLDEAGS